MCSKATHKMHSTPATALCQARALPHPISPSLPKLQLPPLPPSNLRAARCFRPRTPRQDKSTHHQPHRDGRAIHSYSRTWERLRLPRKVDKEAHLLKPSQPVPRNAIILHRAHQEASTTTSMHLNSQKHLPRLPVLPNRVIPNHSLEPDGICLLRTLMLLRRTTSLAIPIQITAFDTAKSLVRTLNDGHSRVRRIRIACPIKPRLVMVMKSLRTPADREIMAIIKAACLMVCYLLPCR